jgi:multiple antibiotic resistance protein
MLALAAAILLVHALLWAAMRYSVVIARVLGQGGITVLTRISGVLLAAIAVQLVADAVRGFVMAG